eukprot:15472354-Alexandrium_andersonii.AAC.1
MRSPSGARPGTAKPPSHPPTRPAAPAEPATTSGRAPPAAPRGRWRGGRRTRPTPPGSACGRSSPGCPRGRCTSAHPWAATGAANTPRPPSASTAARGRG